MEKVEVQLHHSVYVDVFIDIKPYNFQKQITIYAGLHSLHSTKILAVVLYGCEPRFHTLREEHKFQVGVSIFENLVPENIVRCRMVRLTKMTGSSSDD
jgi:hypothetical protein